MLKKFKFGELRRICIENKWFTAGTIEQYDKLFEANRMGLSIEHLATIIWVCSDGVSRDYILSVLYMRKGATK